MPDEMTQTAEGPTAAADGTPEATEPQTGPQSLADAYAATEVTTEAEPETENEAPVAQEQEGGEGTTAPDTDAGDSERYARFGRDVQQAFAQDPLTVIERFIAAAEGADPKFRAQLAARLGGAQTETGANDEPPFDPEQYEAASDFEAAMLPHYGMLSGLPEFANGVNQNFETIALEVRALRDLVGGLMDAQGIGLPRPDLAAVRAAVKNGDIAGAYDAVYGQSLARAVEEAKQARKARETAPKTLRGASAAPSPTKEPTSLMEAFERTGIELGLT